MVTEVFIKGRKLKMYFVVITQSYFADRKSIRLNSTHLFIMKIPSKRELQQIAINRSSDFDLKELQKIFTKNVLQSHIFY